MGNKTNSLYKALRDYPRKRITLEELDRICSDHEQLAEQIKELTEQGVLIPVRSSKTNGNLKMPLYMKYTICIEKTAQISPDEINALYPRLSANGYLLRNREQFVNNKEFLCRLSEWLTQHEDDGKMSRRERSFSIFCDEKMFINYADSYAGQEEKLRESFILHRKTLKDQKYSLTNAG